MKVTNFGIPAVCAVAGISIGIVLGYFIAKKKLSDKFEKKANEDLKHYIKKNLEGSKPTKEDAKKIAESFPTEEWANAVGKESEEKRKDYKKLIRSEKYYEDDDGEVDEKEVFDSDKFDSETKRRCKEQFEDEVETYAEYCGISKEQLLDEEVSIITESEYYDETHTSEPTDLEWDPMSNILRDEDGEILDPDIIFGENRPIIIRKIEENTPNDTWLHDKRLDKYYCVCVNNPRLIK